VRFWIAGDIEIHSVRVLFVVYYNPAGEVIANIKREDIQVDALVTLDQEAFDYISEEVVSGESIFEDMWEGQG
jgi:hypothetical protein